jgi:antitoxin component of RelBE/YafQ-DinJ toxin-antitoxin module
MSKSKLTLSVDDKVKEQAKILSAKTRISVSEIVELLIQGTSEKEILKLYDKKS